MPRPKLWILKVGTTEPVVRARHGDFEDWFRAGLGRSAAEVPIRAVHEGAQPPPVAEVAGAIVTGSSAMVTDGLPWSERAADWLAQLVEREVPLLAICYGHQLLASATGGTVGWNPRGPEVGTVAVHLTDDARDDPLLTGLPSPLAVQQSHSQSVLTLPPDARLLCANEHDPVQGFRVGSCAWGFQFHPEFDAAIVRGYVESRRASIAAEGLDPDALLATLGDTTPSRSILARFAALVEARDA